MMPAPGESHESATPAAHLPLRTERTLLRLAEPEDVAELLAFHTRNFAHLAPSSPRRPESFLTEAHWQQAITREPGGFRDGTLGAAAALPG